MKELTDKKLNGQTTAKTQNNQVDAGYSRRSFLAAGLTGLAGLAILSGSRNVLSNVIPIVETVRGPLPADKLGFTLPHEHIIVDWNGKDGKSKERYNQDDVFRIMLPCLKDVQDLGVRTFVDCAPPWLGRDAALFKRLSETTGLNIITPTGLYEKKYAPKFAFEASLEEIADFFAGELTNGMESTGIKAGFIKIGVSNEGEMTDNDEKIVRAACRAHKQTGASIKSHTFQGKSALRQLDILDNEKVNPSAFTYVHASFESDISFNIEAAKRGCWIEYDNIREETAEKIISWLKIMLDKGFDDQLLLSQDRGWYIVGEKDGGKIQPYTYLPAEFLPRLESEGVPRSLIESITCVNPGRSYAIIKS